MLQPYLLAIKIGLVVATVGVLISLGIWVRGAFAERDSLRVSEAQSKQEVATYAKALADNQRLQEGIANAVKNIRVVSNNYIQSVEADPPPAVPDGGTFMLVAPGVPTAVSNLPTFANVTTGRVSASTAGH